MSLLSRRSKCTNKAARRRRPSLRSDFELLEDRRLLAPLDFLVTNNADSGPGSLRQAILDANATSGSDTIDFNISVGAVAATSLPASGSQPEGIAAGPDNNLWFTESDASKIGRITPNGTITEFTIPTANSFPIGITAGPDGNLWFAEEVGNKIGRITPNGTINEFTIGFVNSQPVSITAGPDGNLWFTGGNNIIGRVTPSGTMTEFTIPTANCFPGSITAGPDGNLWFVEEDSNKIGRITPAGMITEFPIPTANSQLSPTQGITTGPDGNLWFTESDASKIGRITPSGTITEFTIPTSNSQPEGITKGPDGNLWFTETGAAQIGRITPSGTITEFSSAGSNEPFGITAGSDGNLWFTDLLDSIGRVTVSSSGLTISPTSALPTITDPVVIDATSQPGYAGSPIIEIDGSGAGAADGLTIQASGCTVAGLVINRFTADGILLENSGSNLIEGDFIGTDVTGTLALGNSGSGIDLFNSPGNTIGGTTAGTRNVISGNKIFGIYVSDAGSNGNLILGNFIGTDVTGTQSLGNSSNGISVFGAAGNTIGGTAIGAGNVISGNDANGITFGPAGSVAASGNLVQGNFIGTDVTGTQNLGNLVDGILINQSTDNTIGGATTESGNVIAFNTGAAVTVATGTGNAIRQNSIFANGQGIVLVNGGNADQPAPTLTAADSFPGTTMVEGQLSGFAASATYTIEFFASAPGDPSTPGQAHVFLGSQTFTTNGSGAATISATLSATVPVGQVVTATATSPADNTSEFATGVIVASAFVVTNTNDSGIGSLRQVILNADREAGHTISFAIPGAGVHAIAPTSALPTITDPVIIDGYTQPGASPNTLAVGDNAILLIELNGANAGIGVTGLTITAGSSTVRGLVINRFGGNGVAITGSGASNNVVLGNLIGTDAMGELAVPNSANGVLIDGSSNNTIGGTAVGARNVISGNIGAGVSIDPGATNNVVLGNFIGTDATGELAVPNRAAGVLIGESSNNTIGGTAVGALNVISDNIGAGVIFGLGATKNVVQGNNVSGNSGAGVSFGPGATKNVVQGNNVSGNSGAGVSFGPGATNNLVQDNVITGNIGTGVSGPGAASNLVQGNLISGNGELSLPPPSNTQPSILLVGAQNSSLALIATLVVTSLNGVESQIMSVGSGTASVPRPRLPPRRARAARVPTRPTSPEILRAAYPS